MSRLALRKMEARLVLRLQSLLLHSSAVLKKTLLVSQKMMVQPATKLYLINNLI
jgi:hypothetical protein